MHREPLVSPSSNSKLNSELCTIQVYPTRTRARDLGKGEKELLQFVQIETVGNLRIPIIHTFLHGRRDYRETSTIERARNCGELGDDVAAGFPLLDGSDHTVELTARPAQPIQSFASRLSIGVSHAQKNTVRGMGERGRSVSGMPLLDLRPLFAACLIARPRTRSGRRLRTEGRPRLPMWVRAVTRLPYLAVALEP